MYQDIHDEREAGNYLSAVTTTDTYIISTARNVNNDGPMLSI
jgi:hypothetical protein